MQAATEEYNSVSQRFGGLLTLGCPPTGPQIMALIGQIGDAETKLRAVGFPDLVGSFQEVTQELRKTLFDSLLEATKLQMEPQGESLNFTGPAPRLDDRGPPDRTAGGHAVMQRILSRTKQDPPKFDPKRDNPRRFLDKFEFWAYCTSGEFKNPGEAPDGGAGFAAVATMAIQGDGRPDWFLSIREGDVSWAMWRKQFLLEYDVGVPQMDALDRLDALKMGSGPDAVIQLHQRLRTLFIEADVTSQAMQQWFCVNKLPVRGGLRGHALLQMSHGCTTEALMRDICARAGVFSHKDWGAATDPMDLSAARFEEEEDAYSAGQRTHDAYTEHKQAMREAKLASASFASVEHARAEVHAEYAHAKAHANAHYELHAFNNRSGAPAPGRWQPQSSRQGPPRGYQGTGGNPPVPSRGYQQGPNRGGYTSGRPVDPERQRRRDNNLCLACGEGGHWQHLCPKNGGPTSGKGGRGGRPQRSHSR
jgi:hypothetical protein